jgi:hypothetical protein
LDSVVARIASAIGILCMPSWLGSSAYAKAAGAEAHGVHALSMVVAQSLSKETAHGARLAVSAPQVAL